MAFAKMFLGLERYTFPTMRDWLEDTTSERIQRFFLGSTGSMLSSAPWINFHFGSRPNMTNWGELTGPQKGGKVGNLLLGQGLPPMKRKAQAQGNKVSSGWRTRTLSLVCLVCLGPGIHWGGKPLKVERFLCKGRCGLWRDTVVEARASLGNLLVSLMRVAGQGRPTTDKHGSTLIGQEPRH
jgi:hypothetical protein